MPKMSSEYFQAFTQGLSEIKNNAKRNQKQWKFFDKQNVNRL